MSDDRKRPLWPWIVALLIGLPVVYLLSFGPACLAVQLATGKCITYAGSLFGNSELIDTLYAPLDWMDCKSEFAASVIWWYGTLFLPN